MTETLKAEDLFSARAPEVLAKFKTAPFPEDLLALGAEVKDTPLHVGKWRGTGARTRRYLLELPYPKAVLYRGRFVNRLVLKVSPSGRAEVEEASLDEEGSLWRDLEDSQEVWAAARGLGLEEAALELFRGHPSFREGREGARARLRRWNSLLSQLVWLKTRAFLPLAYPEAPIAYFQGLHAYRDPGATLEGTLENLRRGLPTPFPGYDPARDPGVGIALYPELGAAVPEPTAFPEEPRPLSREVLESLPDTPLLGREELEGALEVFPRLLQGVKGERGPYGMRALAALEELASYLTLAEVARHTAQALRGLGLPEGKAEKALRREKGRLLERAKGLGLRKEDLDLLAPLFRLVLRLPTGPGGGFSGEAFL